MSIGEFLNQQALAIDTRTKSPYQSSTPYQTLNDIAERYCAEHWKGIERDESFSEMLRMLVAITIYCVAKNHEHHENLFFSSLALVKNKIHFLRYQSIAEIKRTLTEIIEQL